MVVPIAAGLYDFTDKVKQEKRVPLSQPQNSSNREKEKKKKECLEC